MEIRKLTIADFDQALALGREAFGPPPPGAPAPTAPTEEPPGRHTWGAFDGGRLVAKVVGLELSSWWGGQQLATCGIAGVAVSAEHRGRGLLRDLFAVTLEEAAGRSEVLSTLYPTAAGIYRPFGYEVVTAYDAVELPTAELARLRPATGTRTRRATAADVPDVRAVYARWASGQNGPLTRTGPRFQETDAELLDDYTAVSVAVDSDDRVVGYVAWDRHEGYGKHAVVEAWDLVALTQDAYRALWTLLGSFASVTGTVRVRTSGADLARLVLPAITWSPVERHHHPYMLRVSDVAGALTALRPEVPGMSGTVELAVAGDRFEGIDGRYRLDLVEGPGRCERVPGGSDDVPVFTPQGLALAFAGAQSCANLRLLDHLTGPATHDAVLDAVLGGRQVHVRDYF